MRTHPPMITSQNCFNLFWNQKPDPMKAIDIKNQKPRRAVLSIIHQSPV